MLHLLDHLVVMVTLFIQPLRDSLCLRDPILRLTVLNVDRVK
jgi:hypothetical protein